MIEIVSDLEIFDKVKSLPLAHCSELEMEENAWQEEEFNYRLNVCDTKFYVLKDKEVVGHLGLLDNVIKSVYINPDHRGEGLTILLYKHAFSIFGQVFSDDAREPGGEAIWKKLMELYPENIKYHKKADQYEYNPEGFE